MTTIDRRLNDLEQVTNAKDGKIGKFLVVYEHEDKPGIYILDDEREVDQVELDKIAENYETVIYVHYQNMTTNEVDYARLGEVDYAE